MQSPGMIVHLTQLNTSTLKNVYVTQDIALLGCAEWGLLQTMLVSLFYWKFQLH